MLPGVARERHAGIDTRPTHSPHTLATHTHATHTRHTHSPHTRATKTHTPHPCDTHALDTQRHTHARHTRLTHNGTHTPHKRDSTQTPSALTPVHESNGTAARSHRVQRSKQPDRSRSPPQPHPSPAACTHHDNVLQDVQRAALQALVPHVPLDRGHHQGNSLQQDRQVGPLTGQHAQQDDTVPHNCRKTHATVQGR